MVDAGGLGPETHITLTGDDPDDTVRIGGTDRPRFLTGRVDPNSEQGILLSAVDVGGNETQIISLRDGNPTLEFEVTGAPGNDWITTYTDPDPEVLGQELSTFGDKSIEEIIQSRPEAFEQACGCSLGAPDRIDVRRPDTPTEIRLDEAAIGGTVLAWNGSGWAPPADGQELPETVPLMGTEAPVGYFAFLTDREGGDGVRATLLMAAVTDRTSSGDIVVASHVAERQHPPVESTIEVVGQTGIFTLGEVAGIADRFAPVCPSMTTTIDIPEATGTEAS